MKIGYARVSTKTQQDSLQNQREQLEKMGCERIFSEIASDMKSARPQLSLALDYAREGDTLIVTRLDRLGCSTIDRFRRPYTAPPPGIFSGGVYENSKYLKPRSFEKLLSQRIEYPV